MYFDFGYNYLWKDTMHYNVYYEYFLTLGYKQSVNGFI